MGYRAAFDADEASEIIAELKPLEGPLLPILNALQHRYGHVGEDAVRLVSAALNLTRAEVYGRRVLLPRLPQGAPRPSPPFKVCRAEACPGRGWR